MKTNKATDCYGRTIYPGDIIHYPGRRSSNLWVNFARVCSMDFNTDWRGNEHVVLKVEIIVEHNSEYTWTKRTYMQKRSIKKVTVHRLDRVLILEGDSHEQLNQRFNDAENSTPEEVYLNKHWRNDGK